MAARLSIIAARSKSSAWMLATPPAASSLGRSSPQGSWHRHALAGTYVGASTEATLGVGLGANWLIGGSGKSFALQPWSVQGQAGLNYSLTWTNLTLN